MILSAGQDGIAAGELKLRGQLGLEGPRQALQLAAEGDLHDLAVTVDLEHIPHDLAPALSKGFRLRGIDLFYVLYGVRSGPRSHR